jgi:glycosyltransferase involved in cell wall biosynthesis
MAKANPPARSPGLILRTIRGAMPPQARHDVIRFYYTARSAHLERAAAYAPASLMFAHRNYDFDSSVIGDLDLVEGSLAHRLAVLARSRPRVLEVNEPLMRPGIAQTAAAVLVVRLANLGRDRTRVVTYAIENRDPYESVPPGWKARVRRRLEHRLSRFIAAQLDDIVYGTPGARGLYDSSLGRELGGRGTIVLALPAPCECLSEAPALGGRHSKQVVFIGDFSERKGVPALLAAWPLVHARQPDVSLTLIGTGALLPEVREAAERDSSISVLVKPPRREIHALLRASDVLVLLSQRTPRWREQVGLPIVEALSHGCRVVTTSETGLAEWLDAHGHAVLDPRATASQVADAVRATLADGPSADEILAGLPDLDGREEADRRLVGGT